MEGHCFVINTYTLKNISLDYKCWSTCLIKKKTSKIFQEKAVKPQRALKNKTEIPERCIYNCFANQVTKLDRDEKYAVN